MTSDRVPGGGYDLIVIGGGINGAGIARDAALRGLNVLLLEARDFGSGTSSWSSRLIHGGLRYLEHGEISLVYESLHERRCLQRIAAHLVRPLRITIPLYRGGRPSWLVRIGMLAYDVLSFGKELPRHRMRSREQLLGEVPGVNPVKLRGGAQYFDAQVTYAERLVIENVIAAAQAGADVRNYSPVTAVDLDDGRVRGVTFRDRASGTESRVNASCVINAAGPWVDRVLSTSAGGMPRLVGGTKGSHIVVGAFRGAPQDAFYVESVSDGRPVFILPWNDQYLIGTTDIRYDGDPADASASPAEVDYLLDATNAVFPGANLQGGDIHYAYAGVRPLPYQTSGPESAITRRHIIFRHAAPANGLISIVGGKLTTYRNLAEQAVDRAIGRKAKTGAGGSTASQALPGAVGIDEAEAALRSSRHLPDACRQRLSGIYGGRVLRLLQLMADESPLAETLGADRDIVAAEVILAIRDEFARTLVDIMHRRLMIGLSRDLGASAVDDVLRVAADELRWNTQRAERERAALTAYNRRLRQID